jgi:hypothetical protein
MVGGTLWMTEHYIFGDWFCLVQFYRFSFSIQEHHIKPTHHVDTVETHLEDSFKWQPPSLIRVRINGDA